jgi:hypothetical protein
LREVLKMAVVVERLPEQSPRIGLPWREGEWGKRKGGKGEKGKKADTAH